MNTKYSLDLYAMFVLGILFVAIQTVFLVSLSKSYFKVKRIEQSERNFTFSLKLEDVLDYDDFIWIGGA